MEYTNHLWKLIQLYPDKPWDWFRISRNPNITWEIIENNPDKPWNWTRISRNKFEKHPIVIKKKELNARTFIISYLTNDVNIPKDISHLITWFTY